MSIDAREALADLVAARDAFGAWMTGGEPRGDEKARLNAAWANARAALAAPAQQPVALTDEQRLHEFRTGICVGLQVMTAFDDGVAWAELVRAAGVDAMLNHAAFVEPEEWELAGFAKYAKSELGRAKPRTPHPAAPSDAQQAVWTITYKDGRAWSGDRLVPTAARAQREAAPDARVLADNLLTAIAVECGAQEEAAQQAVAPDEYEVRADGKRVRKDRWQVGIRRIVALLWGNRHEFEVDEVVEAVRKLIPQPFNDGDDEGLVQAVLAAPAHPSHQPPAAQDERERAQKGCGNCEPQFCSYPECMPQADQQAAQVVAPFTRAQVRRLYKNSPAWIVDDVASFASFARVVSLVESAHGINASPDAAAEGKA
jgi:hypothetical protein